MAADFREKCKIRAHAFEDAIAALKSCVTRDQLMHELEKLRAYEYQKMRDFGPY